MDALDDATGATALLDADKPMTAGTGEFVYMDMDLLLVWRAACR